MKAKLYQFSDYSDEPLRNKLVPFSQLDAIPLEERLPALDRHIDALNEAIDKQYEANQRQLRRLRKAQARFKKAVRAHKAAQQRIVNEKTPP